MKPKTKDNRVNAKYFHITLQNLEGEQKLDYWVGKGMSFRANTLACLVGLEENHEEGKGVHAHIVIQLSTRTHLSRKQFVDHFGTESIHVSVPKNKNDLLNVLGYASKTGNTQQEGTFTHRGVELDANPEVYRFQHQVKTVDDGISYFKKVIKEHIETDKNVIKKFAKREDAIGTWLQKHRTHTKTLIKLAHTWYLDHANEAKQGFGFSPFIYSKEGIKDAYMAYLKDFPSIFAANLPERSSLKLERDYNSHASHDLDALEDIVAVLAIAKKYGFNRPHKSLNLYLWSTKPSFGKTRLLDFLDARMMAYRLPDDQYYVDYENKLYQVLVSDEAAAFIKSKDYSHLKHILEGKRVEFNMKGKEKIYKEDNPLIVLADNVSFDDLMRKHHKDRYSHDVMSTRVLSVELRSRATLHFFLDKCIINGSASKQLTLGFKALNMNG